MQNDVVVYENGEQSLAVTRDPAEVLAEAQHAAECLVKVVSGKKKPVIFNGEQYLEFEDWQTVGKFYHVASKAISTEEVIINDGVGFKAHAIAIDTVTGAVVSEADALCLNSEPNWANKPMFQLCSMAQTRACAKALRNVLAWVVVLAGYRPTPAEEVPSEGFPSASNGKSGGKPQSAMPKPAGKHDPNELMGFGKHKAETWANCPSGYLEWLAAQIDEKTGNPSDRALRAKVELERRSGATEAAPEAKDGPPTGEEPTPERPNDKGKIATSCHDWEIKMLDEHNPDTWYAERAKFLKNKYGKATTAFEDADFDSLIAYLVHLQELDKGTS